MSFENRLAEAMRHTAETMEPRVDALVSGGIARGRRRRLRRAAATGTAGAVAVAALATALVVTDGDGSPAAPSPSPPARLVSATQVLGNAARTVQTQRWTRPRPTQWLYEKTLEYGIAAEHGPRPVTDENWMRLDGAEDADIQHGKLVMYRHTARGAALARKSYERLAELPTDPGKLRAALEKDYTDIPPDQREFSDPDAQLFRTATQTLWDSSLRVPPKTQAALYRLIATIPGVRVDRNVTDGAGRPAIAVSRGYGQRFLLDPVTYRMVAQQTVSNGHNTPTSRSSGGDQAPVGTVIYSLTLVTTKIVNKAGQR
ncbi:CU044_5270 family protein [Actinomadura napierensis]|uniref:CU044_5270 family protein n=1 Tax=Actinomadura napierensis TaxID=267854 RepID=A0ABN2YMY4_9ACTN